MDSKSIGRSIKSARVRSNLTQEQLAERSDLSPGYISQIEAGRKCASLPAIAKIADALGTLPSELLSDDAPDHLSHLFRLLQSCAPEELEIISDIIVSLKASLSKHLIK